MQLYKIPTEQLEVIAAYHAELEATSEGVESGDITPDAALELDEKIAERLAERLDAIEGAFNIKAEAVAKMIRNLEADSAVQKAKAEPFLEEARRYQARAKAADSSVKWLKGYLLHQLERMNLKKVEGVDLKVGRQNNGRPAIVVLDLVQVPPEMLIPQEPKLDSQAALDAWKLKGKTEDAVPGLKVELGQHVRIR